MKAQFINATEKQYHDDALVDVPCYSNSIGKLILNKSPRHAYLEHPKLNPDYESEEEAQKFAVGTVAHAALLQGLDVCEPLDFADWRTNAAKEARDAAYLAGKIPMLQKQFEEVQAMVAAATLQIQECAEIGHINLLQDGQGEQTILASDGETFIKARLDWLHNDRSIILDYKTTDIETPEAWMRSMITGGSDMQAALYMDLVELECGKKPDFVFCVQETKAPFAMYFVGVSPEMYEFGKRRNGRAIQAWKNCMNTGVWPSYTQRIMYPEVKPWFEADFVEKEAVLQDTQKKMAGVGPVSAEAFLFGKVK